MTLTEFLLARIADDKAVDPNYGFLLNIELHESGCLELGAVERSDADCDCSGPKRWLAEVEAKRRIVDLHRAETEESDDYAQCGTCLGAVFMATGDVHGEKWPCATLRLLALPYSDHPDYDPEWRP